MDRKYVNKLLVVKLFDWDIVDGSLVSPRGHVHETGDRQMDWFEYLKFPDYCSPEGIGYVFARFEEVFSSYKVRVSERGKSLAVNGWEFHGETYKELFSSLLHEIDRVRSS